MLSNIKKLSQDIINKIAAGEVIERPSSVVKELVDNSIDAEATEINIKISEGGLRDIEVSDNGSGIDKDDLPLAFESHATSKINSLEDLNEILTMGFRGEALSTIQSVSEVIAITKYFKNDSGYKLEIKDGVTSEIEKSPRDNGTTIKVSYLFKKIPARLKYMKSSETEYRKILEILYPYFLIHPEIHFTFIKDGKQVINLPTVQSAIKNTIHPSRVKQLIKADFTEEMFDFFYEGEGTKIGGLIAHPKFHAQKTQWQYVFVNNRPVTDKGIFRAIHQAYSGYIPNGEKIPYIINISLSPSSVDVNVHPKKSEVRFLNPYRIYTAVEDSVIACLKRNIKLVEDHQYNSQSSDEEISFSRLRDVISGSHSSYKQEPTGRSREVDYRKKTDSSIIQESLDFSEAAIKNDSLFNTLHQIFNKYIIVEFTNEIWIVDQHAAAERVTFEKLTDNRNNKMKEVQSLLTPEEIQLDLITLEFVKENVKVFEEIGFGFIISEQGLALSSIPAELIGVNYEKIFKTLLLETEEGYEIKKQAKDIDKEIIALISCHTSIRTGQKLEHQRMYELLSNLMKCKNPYSCPHGRPAVWKMSLSQIDKNFDRSY